MKKTFVAQQLIERLNLRIKRQLDLQNTLVLGVVLKGLPVAYGLARMNDVIPNFVPLVAQRHVHMQHQIESYFPSLEWKAYFNRVLKTCQCILIIDDVFNTGFTRQKVEGIVHSLIQEHKRLVPLRFAALVLNRKRLASSCFVRPSDIYALEVEAEDVECDWGLMTVPLWDLSIEEAINMCEEYFERFWMKEKRLLTITY